MSEFPLPYVEPIAPSTSQFRLLLIMTGAFLWSLLSGFAANLESLSPLLAQGLGFLMALVLLSMAEPRWLFTIMKSSLGKLALVFVAASLASQMSNESSGVGLFRNLLVFPALGILYAVSRSYGWRTLQFGITCGGLVFVVYHLAFLDMAELSNPRYRLSVFLNTNGVGFIGAMTGTSLLGYFVGLWKSNRRTLSLIPLVLFAMCVLLCFATKSRTANLALLVSSGYVGLRFAGRRGIPFLVIFAAAFFYLQTDASTSAFERLGEIFSFNERSRSLSSGTGRFEIWQFVINDVWLPNFWLGIGPGEQGPYVDSVIRQAGAHNGVLAYLADVGALGTLPILGIFGLALRYAWKLRHDPVHIGITALLFGGIVESGAEQLFLSIGNPGSILVLLGVSALFVAYEQATERAFDQPFVPA